MILYYKKNFKIYTKFRLIHLKSPLLLFRKFTRLYFLIYRDISPITHNKLLYNNYVIIT